MEQEFHVLVIALIIDGKTEDALEVLSRYYDVPIPEVRVGLPKKHKRRALACYTINDHTISFLDSDAFKNPFLVLHEFYHHLRTVNRKHRGTEKYANTFASEFLQSYLVHRSANNGK